MDIEGLGPALIDQLVDKKIVKSLTDLYLLKVEQLKELERMGEKSAQNLVEGISASKNRGLSRVLTALGIRHVGEHYARLLATEFKNIHTLMAASEERLAQIPGVGPIAAESVHRFFQSEAGIKIIENLEQYGVKMAEESYAELPAGRSRLEGKTFVVTGSMSHSSRAEMEGLIRRLGGKTSSSVSRNTDYVIVGSNPGSKLERAKELKVAILSEEEFEQLLVFSD